jgi:DNA-binding winged helix-turn-helix (wHTH) protein
MQDMFEQVGVRSGGDSLEETAAKKLAALGHSASIQQSLSRSRNVRQIEQYPLNCRMRRKNVGQEAPGAAVCRSPVKEESRTRERDKIAVANGPTTAGRRSTDGDEVIYAFDNYTFDVDKRELRAAGRVIQLQPQVFDLLQFLLANRDRVVSKEELLAAVWRGRIVSESTLASRINAARRAIGDNGDEQRLIGTILRKGFRFVGEARELSTIGDAGATASASSSEGPLGTPSAAPKQMVTFCRTGSGANLAVASAGSGAVVVRAGHWGTHVEYDLQNPLTGPLLQRLAGSYQLIRYDGRGTGLSDWGTSEIAFDTFLVDLETVVDSLRLERFALLGMHSGAAVSIAYAVRYIRSAYRNSCSTNSATCLAMPTGRKR